MLLFELNSLIYIEKKKRYGVEIDLGKQSLFAIQSIIDIIDQYDTVIDAKRIIWADQAQQILTWFCTRKKIQWTWIMESKQYECEYYCPRCGGTWKETWLHRGQNSGCPNCGHRRHPYRITVWTFKISMQILPSLRATFLLRDHSYQFLSNFLCNDFLHFSLFGSGLNKGRVEFRKK